MPGPLEGKRILLTRERAPSLSMANEIQALGGEARIVPVMKIMPRMLTEEDLHTLRNANHYDWIILTSPNGVKSFMAHIKDMGIVLSHAKIVTVGKKTADAIRALGFEVAWIPDEYTAERLAHTFIEKEPGGASILLPLGNLAKAELEQELQKAHFVTKRVNVYQTVINNGAQEELIKIIREEKLDVITFASPSAIQFFLSMTNHLNLKDFWKQTIVACIGSVSADYAVTRGLKPQIIPDTYTGSELIKAIAEYYSAS